MCLNPIKVKNSPLLPVPCSKCSECKGRRVSGWSFRLLQQEKISLNAKFITLTYADQQASRSRNGFLQLDVRHLQLFFKRIRKNQGKRSTRHPLKYYAAGEYGGITQRPHYHVIIFNASIQDIEKAWTYGAVHYGDVSGASVGYTLKYISKPPKKQKHKNDDRKKEFSVMSKGLGLNYITAKMVQWHKDDLLNRMYINIGDGKKASMPRYFKDKIYTEAEREAIAATALIRGIEKLANDPNLLDPTTIHNRTQVKLKNFRQQLETYKDSL